MNIIEYKEKYKSDCLTIFDSNTPKYFMEEERELFESFLDIETKANPYFVVEENKAIVGCGGYEVLESEAGLTWGMVLNSVHAKQVGTKLLQYRLGKLLSVVNVVKIDTSQHTEAFFKKFGFVTLKRVQNGYGAGLDKVSMQLRL